MPTEPVSRLSHYQLIEKIGAGGMGVVWKALDLSLDRPVAIKVLPDALAHDHEWRGRFEREARAVATLNHPNIVTIHSVEEAGGVHFFTMELVEGRTLAGMIPERGLPLGTFLDLAVPLVDAVAAAHARGVVHRDLKPANVMVSDEGRVKVLDFGLARVESRDRVGARPADTAGEEDSGDSVSGTVPYMSPEQLSGAPTDHRTDLFSLGVMLFEMASGQRPFAGETAAAVASAILNDPPPELAALRTDLPHSLGRVIRHCLQKAPARRLPSARDLHRELADLKRENDAARRAATPSIAVLPFVDLSHEKDQEHLCDGIAEEIINLLARLGNLRVASRTSTFRFKGTARTAREIGLELGVDALLEGSVRKENQRLRVTAELSGAADGYCLWSDHYDREMKEVFAIQDEIAWRIAQALEVRLRPGERQAVQKVATSDVEAYDFYLRGRKYFYQYSRRGISFALEMFARAIERDSGYALALSGIADCHAYLYLHVDRSDINRRKSEEASRAAVEIDPDLAQGHASRGLALSLLGRHEEAEASFERAIHLDARLFEAFYFYARDSFAQGKREKAIGLYEKAGALRPEDYQAPLLAAQSYDDLGRRAEADAARRRGVKSAEDHLETHPEDVRAIYMAANGMVAMGERERGLEWARRALELDPEDAMLLYNVACIFGLAGQVDPALDCLERAVHAGLVHREWIVADSNLDAIRDHPRYHAILRGLDQQT